MVGLNNAADDGQAEAAAFGLGGGEHGLERTFLQIRTHAGPGVFKFHDHLIRRVIGRNNP